MESRVALVSLIFIALWSIVISAKNREQCSTDLINPCHETLQSLDKGLKLSEIRKLLLDQVADLRECRKYNFYGTPYGNIPSTGYKPVVGSYGYSGYKPYVNSGYNYYNIGYKPGYNPGYKPGYSGYNPGYYPNYKPDYKQEYSQQPTYCRNGICKEIGLLRSADQPNENGGQTQASQNGLQTSPSAQSNHNSQSPLGPPIAITLLVYPYPNKGQVAYEPQSVTKIPTTENSDYSEDFGENYGMDDSDYSLLDYLFPDEPEYIAEYEPEWAIFDQAMINEYFLIMGLGELDDVDGISLDRDDSVSVNSTELLKKCSNIHATSYPQLLATIRVMKESLNKRN